MYKIRIGSHINDLCSPNLTVDEIKNQLAKAEQSHELLRTNEIQDEDMLLTALTEYARQQGHNVVVDTYKKAIELREKYDYKYIYGAKNLTNLVKGLSTTIVHYDAQDRIFKNLNDARIPIATGFTNFYIFNEWIRLANKDTSFGKDNTEMLSVLDGRYISNVFEYKKRKFYAVSTDTLYSKGMLKDPKHENDYYQSVVLYELIDRKKIEVFRQNVEGLIYFKFWLLSYFGVKKLPTIKWTKLK
ncbi:hypothetical protein G7L40_00400 [Paenibacillus polymyxa]|uniref:Uncharacterized protein n=1 Tax=Paenibacillus polymyxa TaxID=1406 RepID=A0A378XWH4_PAEPO|nr:hypothetical protein [Paenibacillus polymyxa]MBE7897170.1 hypothetical protein [Paenibacillus polymyxa]MBG9763027.1 hypothetical protein [Paenibacillus polymyxa]MCC3257581.1 hypothetical protein [Paenibacillus polymyxa]QPK51336.1 hypothetical protein G7035_00400 [Paenibacillus polymyxa]QPK56426.1 hypothetical protein G7L40_00400 [Paenibacillus polymyxa]